MRGRRAPPHIHHALPHGIVLLAIVSPGPTSAGPNAAAPSARWDLRGRVGIEVDVEGEVLGADEVLQPGQTVEETLLGSRFREESTLTSATASFDLERIRTAELRAGAHIKAAPARGRGAFQGGYRLPTPLGRFELRDEVEGEWGEEASGGGWIQTAIGSVSWGNRSSGWSGFASASDEESSGQADSTDHVFDYRVLRPRLGFEHPLAGGDAAIRVGLARKWADALAYRASWIEGEWSRFGQASTPTRVRVRAESRFSVGGKGAPSGYQLSEMELAHGFAVGRALSIDLEAESEIWQYAIADDAYRDHTSIVATARLVREADPAAADGAGWRLAAGARGGWLIHESRDDRDYTGGSALLEAGRTSLAGLWLDGSIEAGARRYRRSGSEETLWLDGMDFSISGSDYRFVRASVLGDWSLPARLRGGFSTHYEREDHREPADDVTIWLFTTSLSRGF